MTPKELYETKRKNFLAKVQKHFEFLVLEVDFKEPIHDTHRQQNGMVISDKLEYENRALNKKVTVSNSYHPVDYGFEINMTDLKTGQSQMLHHVLKENQDIEQDYLKESSRILKALFHK